MKFSLITPTLQRESLLRCCQSIDEQTLTDWEHIVMVDCAKADHELWDKIKHPQRKIVQCDRPHRNFGNTCRHNAWDFATGDKIIYLDDDNILSGPRILEDIASLLETVAEPWSIWPILRYGCYFFNDPPGLCKTDTLNIVVNREIARWPDIQEYTADGILVEELKSKYTYAAFPNFQPIGIMDCSSHGI